MDFYDIETVHAMTNVSMKDIYEVTYDISVHIITFDLGWNAKVKSRPQNINNASYDGKFYEIHIKYVIYGYSAYLIALNLRWNWNGKSR